MEKKTPNRPTPTYNSFKGYSESQREKTPQEMNWAQIVNWMADMRGIVQGLQKDLSDYRFAQQRTAMELKEYIGKLAAERGDIGSIMDQILDHLTAPGQPKVAKPAPESLREQIEQVIAELFAPSGHS